MIDRPPIKALIFDVGDILYDASLWRRWLADRLTAFNPAVNYPVLVEAWEEHLVDVYKGKSEYWDAFGGLMKHFAISAADAQVVQEEAVAKGKELQAIRKPMPEVPQTLKQLHQQGIKLVALSDSESGEQGVRGILKQLGIEQYFTAVTSSFDIGHAKPEPEAFDYAIRATGCEKSDCGFVAHDIDELSGAQTHQLYAIGYNYHPQAPADVFVDSFGQLLDLVAKTGESAPRDQA